MSRVEAPMGMPIYRCAVCEDRAWVVATGEDGVERARPCDCQRRRGADRDFDQAQIPERYRHCHIENLDRLNDSLAAARLAAERFVRDYPQHNTGLLFNGPCGSGKTHLGVGVLAELVKRHRVAGLYVDCGLLIRNLQDSFNAPESYRPALLRPIEQAEILLLDDLGGTKPSEFVRDTFAGIINVRYNAARLTLVTTRFPDEAARPTDLTLELQVGTAVRSRLYEMCTTIPMVAEDYRRTFKNADY